MAQFYCFMSPLPWLKEISNLRFHRLQNGLILLCILIIALPSPWLTKISKYGKKLFGRRVPSIKSVIRRDCLTKSKRYMVTQFLRTNKNVKRRDSNKKRQVPVPYLAVLAYGVEYQKCLYMIMCVFRIRQDVNAYVLV